MNENAIGKQVVDAAVRIHRDLAPGLPETVYEKRIVGWLPEEKSLDVWASWREHSSQAERLPSTNPGGHWALRKKVVAINAGRVHTFRVAVGA